ncbi:MAG: hypothetical protein WBB27_17570 [Maribacter sp.]
MRITALAVCATCLLTIISCSSESSENNTDTTQSNYELALVDSLIVPVLETLQITDYNAEKGKFLAYGTSTKTCMEIDWEGNVLKSIDLTGEGPGHFGQGMSALGYLGNNIVIEGAGAYFFYDADWQYMERLTPGSGYIPLKYIQVRPNVVEINGVNTVIKPKDQSYFGNIKLKEDHFNTAMMLEAFTAKSTEPTELLAYPDNSIYKTSDLYYSSHEPRISYNKSQTVLMLALPLEPKLYKYKLTDNGFKLEDSLNLDLRKFRAPQGIPYEAQHENSLKGFGRSNELNYVYSNLNSSILDVSSYGQITMVKYKTGATEPTSITQYQEALKFARLESKTWHSFFIQDKKVLESAIDLGLYVRLNETQFLSPYVNEDEELDYNKFYIYELKKIE